jgi:hypothetical protein
MLDCDFTTEGGNPMVYFNLADFLEEFSDSGLPAQQFVDHQPYGVVEKAREGGLIALGSTDEPTGYDGCGCWVFFTKEAANVWVEGKPSVRRIAWL